MSRWKILAAVYTESFPELRKALGADFSLSAAHTIDEAVELLERQPPDVLVCGLLFDESKMFELLQHVRSHAPQLPVVICRILETQVLSRRALRNIEVGAMAIGAAEFIDLPELEAQCGEQKYERFRELVLRHLGQAQMPGEGIPS